MVIGGFQKFSISDYPGRISAIVFTRGCNFKCPYCHNPELVDPGQYATPINEDEILTFLIRRKNQLQGVVVTGGEPTLHGDLAIFLQRIKELDYCIKLDTNGSKPDLLDQLLSSGLIDFVALDVKAPLLSYRKIAGPAAEVDAIERSVRLVIESGIAHEMRTTFVDSLLSIDDMRAIGLLIRGCMLFAVNRFNPTRCLEPEYTTQRSPSQEALDSIRETVEEVGIPCVIR